MKRTKTKRAPASAVRASRAGTKSPAALLAIARGVVRAEAKAVASLEGKLGASFVRAVETLAACTGKVIVSGAGKSGLIGGKIAATLTSTGTPAVFLHPADALHGDAGLFSPGDAALFVSKSGATDELMALMPYLERHGIPLVSIVAQEGSPLAARSTAALVVGPVVEACPMDLTPTTSVTLTQVMGDCLAVALLERRGFQADDFRFLHPGGVIGRAAARRVEELMHGGSELPMVRERATLREVMLEIMAKRLGIAAVVDARGLLAGVVTDGDFKRILVKHRDPWKLTARDIMGRSPSTIEPGALVAAAVRQMEQRPAGPITALIVVDAQKKPVGILHLHDCLRGG